MIKVTRLNDTILLVNSDLIEFVEETPDTVVTLTTGRKLVVKESAEEIIKRMITYKRLIHQNKYQPSSMQMVKTGQLSG